MLNGLLFQKGGISEGRSQSLESESTMNKSQLNVVKEQCAAIEKECNQLREEKESLAQALSISKQDAELLRAEKEGLLKDLNVEKQKMKGLKEEIRLFSLAFTQREGLLTSLYTKSKVMMENLKCSRVPIPQLCDC